MCGWTGVSNVSDDANAFVNFLRKGWNVKEILERRRGGDMVRRFCVNFYYVKAFCVNDDYEDYLWNIIVRRCVNKN